MFESLKVGIHCPPAFWLYRTFPVLVLNMRKLDMLARLVERSFTKVVSFEIQGEWILERGLERELAKDSRIPVKVVTRQHRIC